MSMSMSMPAHYRCADCKSTSEKPRNLVVFIDGTSNKPGGKNTNVFKLHAQIETELLAGAELEQHAYYLKGIGAYDTEHLNCFSRWGKEKYATFEMVFARSANKNVQEAYRWLASKYQPGDQIYLFGYSRGGYQVRALASMVHEVGLVTDVSYVKTAYNKYLALDKYHPERRKLATDFKQNFCQKEVRVHFVGVWDTVSSLGLIFKTIVHITSSASVTNACHFRQALALDEYRVKFMPEYFLEINAYRSSIRRPRSIPCVVDGVDDFREVGDVEEVWFAGCHSDVGGTDNADEEMLQIPDGYNLKRHMHTDNMPLFWMEREAAANGLLFKELQAPEKMVTEITNSMKGFYKILEGIPIRHQVSFSGAGKHAMKFHWFRPRLVIPCQQIHNSVWSHKAYTPHAVLGNGVRLPPLSGTVPEGIWNVNEAETSNLLLRLLSKETVTLRYLEIVVFLLDSLLGKGYEKSIPKPNWSIEGLREQSNLAKVALNIIGYVTSQPTDSEQFVARVTETLSDVFESDGQDEDLIKILYTLRFSTTHQPLRRRFVCHDRVIKGLVLALKRFVENVDVFSLITDCLNQLIQDDEIREQVVKQFGPPSDGTTSRVRLSVLLGVESPQQLTASLRMIASLAQFRPDLCNELKSRIRELAKKNKELVSPLAVEALVALKEDLTQDIPVSNILSYLHSNLPLLDVEGGSNDLPNIDDLACVRLIVNSTDLKQSFLNELVSTIKSGNSKKCTLATFTLLKLCKHATIRGSCSEYNVLEIFLKQLGRKSTYLLAAYALSICLNYKMCRNDDFYHRAAEHVVATLDKGWFDDSIGRLEGCEIFRRLMTSSKLRKQVLGKGQVNKLLQKLAVCKHHEARMNLIFLDILGHDKRELKRVVTDSLKQLKHIDQKVQKKGVKTLDALGQTAAGEKIIKEHVIEIVNMLRQPNLTRSQIFGPTAVLYDLCKNETLREHIHRSEEFQDLQERHRNGTLYPKKGRTNWWKNDHA